MNLLDTIKSMQPANEDSKPEPSIPAKPTEEPRGNFDCPVCLNGYAHLPTVIDHLVDQHGFSEKGANTLMVGMLKKREQKPAEPAPKKKVTLPVSDMRKHLTVNSEGDQVHPYDKVQHRTAKATLYLYGEIEFWLPTKSAKEMGDTVIFPKWLAFSPKKHVPFVPRKRKEK